jgi:hypothetical protein
MRAIRYMSAAAASLALAVVGAAPATATTTWQLEPIEQRMCVDPDFGHPGAYFVGSVSGSWSTTITTGMRDLPPNSVFKGSSSLPPGSHKNPPGQAIINVFAGVTIGAAPAGEYTAEIWASDGDQTQSMPVKIVFRDGC